VCLYVAVLTDVLCEADRDFLADLSPNYVSRDECERTFAAKAGISGPSEDTDIQPRGSAGSLKMDGARRSRAGK
jgi:hypothetical protein